MQGGKLEFIKADIQTGFELVAIPLDGSSQIQISQRLTQNILKLYGVACYTDPGLAPNGDNLISSADAANLYLTIFQGKNQQIQQLRISDLVYDVNAQTRSGENKYLTVNIDQTIDLDKSFIDNPSNVAAVTLLLAFWYIPRDIRSEMSLKRMGVSDMKRAQM